MTCYSLGLGAVAIGSTAVIVRTQSLLSGTSTQAPSWAAESCEHRPGRVMSIAVWTSIGSKVPTSPGEPAEKARGDVVVAAVLPGFGCLRVLRGAAPPRQRQELPGLLSLHPAAEVFPVTLLTATSLFHNVPYVTDPAPRKE
jgi:hypothetical protein